MILSSADILKILGGNEVIRLSAKLSITDGRPNLSGREGVYIYVDRFPVVEEFEATWSVYIEADEEADLVVAEIKRLLPKVQVEQGLLTVVKTTDFRSESTQVAPEASKAEAIQVDLSQYEERFQGLVEDVQDQMLLVSSGRPGRSGKDGRDGADGRDGKDIEATETDLEDLANVESGIAYEKGQVLTWDGSKWTNLFVRQTMSAGGAVGSGGGSPSSGGIEEAPMDGNYYVRSSGEWLELVSVLDSLGYMRNDTLDGGDFTNVTTDATDDAVVDGGNFQ